MIAYDTGRWGIFFVCRITGSVSPRACAWGLSAALISILLDVMFGSVDLRVDGVDYIWSGYNFVLGFLVVFRNNQAYSRFWEGAALIHQVRGEWMNAASSLVAFCDQCEDKKEDVLIFQHLLVRLMSMLHCSALQMVAAVKDDSFEIIAPDGIENSCLAFLVGREDRCEILMQWIQRMIVEADQDGTLKVAPPILSRVFQELSRGIVNLHNVRKIKEVPFPFPYSQTMAVMLVFHWVTTPIIASQTIDSWMWASVVTFFVVAAMWSLYYIALEIEQPFGEDPNDLPVADMQRDMNRSLTLLLEQEVQCPPSFKLQVSKRGPTISYERSYRSTVVQNDISRFFVPGNEYEINDTGQVALLHSSHSTCSLGDIVETADSYRKSVLSQTPTADTSRRSLMSSPVMSRRSLNSSHSELRMTRMANPTKQISKRGNGPPVFRSSVVSFAPETKKSDSAESLTSPKPPMSFVSSLPPKQKMKLMEAQVLSVDAVHQKTVDVTMEAMESLAVQDAEATAVRRGPGQGKASGSAAGADAGALPRERREASTFSSANNAGVGLGVEDADLRATGSKDAKGTNEADQAPPGGMLWETQKVPAEPGTAHPNVGRALSLPGSRQGTSRRDVGAFSLEV